MDFGNATLAHFHFSLNDLNVSPELLGSTAIVDRDGYRIHFTIPASEDEFGPAWESGESVLAGGAQASDSGEWTCRMLQLVRLSVELELPDAAIEDDLDRQTIDDSSRLLWLAADAARRFVYDYVTRVRTRHGQYWLAHSAEGPRVAWLTTVVDRGTGKKLRIGYADPLKTGVWPSGMDALSTAAHAEAIRAIEMEAEASVPELLLADAMYLAWTADSPRHREAVLLAAVAAEVKIKESLDSACAEPARPLLEFALQNPRDVSVQAAALYDKAAEAVTGRSLRKEDRQLYKGLESLFKHRNAVAHGAVVVQAKQVRADIVAAREAMKWADSLTVLP